MTEAPSSPLEYALAEAPEQTPINAGVPSRPPIDFEQARDFLAALAPGETDFTFQTFDDNDTRDETRPELARVTHGSLAERLSELSPLSALGAGVFVTVNRTDLKGRREANIVAVRALFADLDGAPLSVLERLSLLPHIIAMTSPSRFHVYWRVNGVETAEFAGLQKRLAALLGSDPSVCDLPRVMRLPGFPHQKDPAAPHLVWFQAREHSGPYEADAFRAALAAAERNGVADKGLIGERRPEPRQGRTNGNRAAFPNIHAPAPEPWSEIGERRLRSALKAIPAFDRDTWLKIGFALHDLAAADPRWPSRPMWDEWSRTCPKKFNEADEDKTWVSFVGRDYSGQRAGIGTIYHLAKQHGWRDPTAATADCHASDRKELLGAGDSVEGGIGERFLSEPQATFERLAALSPIEYDRVRIAEAEKLGVRVGTFDQEVLRYRPLEDDARAAGRALSLASPEPWSDPIDGAALIGMIVETINRYVALSSAAAIATALWCVYAHAFEAFYISPRLAIVSPEKRCGKSTLLRVMQPMLPKALNAANITVAAVFRTVEAGRPTLLIDEAELVPKRQR